jgi:hypothetical protein
MNMTVGRRWISCAAFLVLLAAIGMMGLSCKQGNDAAPASQRGSQPAAVYTCPMHPEVLSDKPGNCPKCGMKLVVKK